jgi:hypothetical protein
VTKLGRVVVVTGWVFPVVHPMFGAIGGSIGVSLLARVYTRRRNASQELERSTSAGV